jgi:hypothetical protein
MNLYFIGFAIIGVGFAMMTISPPIVRETGLEGIGLLIRLGWGLSSVLGFVEAFLFFGKATQWLWNVQATLLFIISLTAVITGSKTFQLSRKISRKDA